MVRSLVACAALLLVACPRSDEPAAKPAQIAKPEASTVTPIDDSKAPRVTFAGDKPASVHVEVVTTPEDIRTGLMYRRHLGWDRGMLFLFPEEEQQSFWMKNTLIPLDMIFIRADLSVLGVVENAEPMTTTPRNVDGTSKYVLEVNAGWCKEHGVAAGSAAKFENVPASPSR